MFWAGRSLAEQLGFVWFSQFLRVLGMSPERVEIVELPSSTVMIRSPKVIREHAAPEKQCAESAPSRGPRTASAAYQPSVVRRRVVANRIEQVLLVIQVSAAVHVANRAHREPRAVRAGNHVHEHPPIQGPFDQVSLKVGLSPLSVSLR